MKCHYESQAKSVGMVHKGGLQRVKPSSSVIVNIKPPQWLLKGDVQFMDSERIQCDVKMVRL
jgi:hypothetical protein